jgi:NFU1 iron-sulfur cluster scaffold homolog, mitochondrial
MNPLIIDTLPTPNPNALMFKVEVPLVERGTYEFNAPEKAKDAPLPHRLFQLGGIDQVLVTSRFVTVNKADDHEWNELIPGIKGEIRRHVASGDAAVGETEHLQALDTHSELARQVVDLIDEDIRPAVAQDGGDVQFVGITDDMVVQLRLIGACSSCPSATATLAFGIERLLVEEFPDINGVIQV